MPKLFRFIFLNTYSFLLLFCGLAVLMLPLYRSSFLLLIPQIILSLLFLKPSIRLFSSWKDKQREYSILIGKNNKEFRPESFKIFMQAPCGRLLTKALLKDLNMENRYKELLVYKLSFFASLKSNLKPQKTSIYINEDFQ